MRWSVGVTTAPRADGDDTWRAQARKRGFREGPAIETTLASLRAAGFSNITVFAEPGSHRPSGDCASLYANWVDRPELYGGWDNWRYALDYLGRFNPLCPAPEAILLCQDDVILCKGVREFLDATLWPSNAGVISLYCSSKHATGNGLSTISVGSSYWGALAFAFPPEQAQALLASNIPNTLQGNRIDNRVGLWANSTSRRLWVFTPSLAQHTGEFRSAMRHGHGQGMSANDFVGEDFDARTLIMESAKETRELEAVV